MAKKENDKTDTDNVVDFLTAGHFGQQGTNTPAVGDPVTETMMVLTLDQLTEYDRNPRRALNSEYEALKASFIQTGTTKILLVVTKRPGETLWFPAAGGNTRLRILKELWEEFGNEKYYRVNCKVIPWIDETRVLVDHLSENDNRSDYIFIDRAKGVCGIYAQLAGEQEGSLSQRAFVDRMLELGYPKLSRTQFGRYQYAVRLYEYIPLALDAGMSDRAVRRLEETLDDLKSFLSAACTGDPDVIEAFDGQWCWELDRLDSAEGIDLDALPGLMFESLAPVAMQRVPDLDPEEISSRLTSMWSKWSKDKNLSVSLRQGSVTKRERNDPTRPGPVRHSYFDNPGGDSDSREPGGQVSSVSTEDYGIRHFQPDVRPGSRHTESSTRTGNQGSPPTPDSGTGDSAFPEILHRLWNQNLEHARFLAGNFEFGDHVRTLGVGGAGYWIDLPGRVLSGYAVTAWWLLWDISGIVDLPGFIPRMIELRVAEGSRLEKNWILVQEGLASLSRKEINSFPPDRRSAELLKAFKHLVESGIPRVHDQARWLRHMDDPMYDALFGILGNVRQINRMPPPQ